MLWNIFYKRQCACSLFVEPRWHSGDYVQYGQNCNHNIPGRSFHRNTMKHLEPQPRRFTTSDAMDNMLGLHKFSAHQIRYLYSYNKVLCDLRTPSRTESILWKQAPVEQSNRNCRAVGLLTVHDEPRVHIERTPNASLTEGQNHAPSS